jgi:hypothetical protein
MVLRDLAHSRTGDKGNIITMSLIAYRGEDFPLLEERITVERVSEFFSGLVDRPVVRYVLPHLHALNFVMHRPENESVTRSLALDKHGKCLSSALLGMVI